MSRSGGAATEGFDLRAALERLGRDAESRGVDVEGSWLCWGDHAGEWEVQIFPTERTSTGR